MGNALFVTRAQPFHLGHLKVIKWILRRYDKIIIVIGSSQESNTEKNPFSFDDRIKMIEDSLKSEGIKTEVYQIIGISDVYDEEAWVNNILKKADFDVVFTRNSWTKRCFDHFNILVKEHPIFGEISGSKIREMMKKGEKWEELVPKDVKSIIKNTRKTYKQIEFSE
ncbi:MAG: nicotinamide-nucleotide adenylyltransferase [Candidatus Heimdallarchaeaceae archaeon]|jgi:nicotinamide-nucleotide adenylyltransferase